MPSLPSVYFAAAVAGATFFGVYAILTLAALYLLSHRERSVKTVVMMVLTVVMFGISTIFFALDIRLISGGILHPLKYPRTVINIFGPERTTQIICQGLNTVLSDSIVIWRAWVVWGRRLTVVIVPLVLLVGVAFSSFGMAFSQVRAAHDNLYGDVFQKFIIALPCLTLATNVAATSLVLSRVHALQVSVRRTDCLGRLNSFIGHGVRYRRLVKIIIESGGMYCLTWLILLCLVLSHSTVMHVFLSIIGQLTGIYPTLIIVLVSLNTTPDGHVVQGPVIDSGIKFENSNVAPETTRTRTVSYVLGQAGSSGATIGDDVETGGVFDTEAGPGYEVDTTRASSCEPETDPKEYVVGQDT